jgi:hypothetical protein
MALSVPSLLRLNWRVTSRYGSAVLAALIMQLTGFYAFYSTVTMTMSVLAPGCWWLPGRRYSLVGVTA